MDYRIPAESQSLPLSNFKLTTCRRPARASMRARRWTPFYAAPLAHGGKHNGGSVSLKFNDAAFEEAIIRSNCV
jgi:hypothetical protein